jgi:hypothetical protein
VFDGGEGCNLGVLAGTVLVENFLCLVEGYGDGLHRLMVFCSRTVEVLLNYVYVRSVLTFHFLFLSFSLNFTGTPMFTQQDFTEQVHS